VDSEALRHHSAVQIDVPRTPIHDRIQALADAFVAHGYRLYLVGGPVRDHFLRRAIHDVDLTTDATPHVVRQIASGVKPSSIYDVGAKFGTIGMVFHAPDGQPWPVEVTTFRTEQYAGGTRKPEVQFGTSLIEDLWRRDFTMNAIAIDLHDGTVHDPTGGREAIAQGVIAGVGDATARFRDDPLRLLRAVRFTSQLGFIIDGATEEAIASCAGELARISPERIAAELNLILLSDRASDGIRRATTLGLMAHAIPELLPMRAMSQRPRHHKDVFEHTMSVLDNLDGGDLGLRWAALLHDIGKPSTKSEHDGVVHFLGHEEVGARMARQILRGLHLDGALVTRVESLIRNHLRINSYEDSWTDAAVRRLIREVDPYLDDLIKLSRADVTGRRRDAAMLRADEFARRAAELQAVRDAMQLQSPIDGDELMALFGRPPGPWIRPIKEYLLNLVIDGDLAEDDVETARTLAREFMERTSG
jgi:poly(A) polymerase